MARMEVEMRTKKRSVPLTREVQVLRFFRRSRGISLVAAGRLIGVDGSAIVHMEQGRMALPPTRLRELVSAYGYSMAEFNEYLSGKEIPTNLVEECSALLSQLSEANLRIVHGFLKQFANR